MRSRPANTVTVAVEIWDGNEVIRAARARMREDKVRWGRGLTAEDAAQYLIDPGAIPGCKVLESSRE